MLPLVLQLQILSEHRISVLQLLAPIFWQGKGVLSSECEPHAPLCFLRDRAEGQSHEPRLQFRRRFSLACLQGKCATGTKIIHVEKRDTSRSTSRLPCAGSEAGHNSCCETLPTQDIIQCYGFMTWFIIWCLHSGKTIEEKVSIWEINEKKTLFH